LQRDDDDDTSLRLELLILFANKTTNIVCFSLKNYFLILMDQTPV